MAITSLFRGTTHAASTGSKSLLWGAAKMPFRAGVELMRAGPIGRTVLGAGIGAGVGFFGTDYNSPTNTIGSTISGAIWGGLIGGTVGSIPTIARNRTLRTIGKAGAKGSIGLVGAPLVGVGYGAFKAAKFAWRHPGIAGGMALGAYGINAAFNSPVESPSLTGGRMDVDFNQQAIAAEELRMSTIAPMGAMGTAPEMLGAGNRRMAASTQGLVGGLHRGRHG